MGSTLQSRRFVRLPETWTGAKGWGRYGVVCSDVESLFLVEDRNLVERSHIDRQLAEGQRMAEYMLSGLDQPSHIHCPVTPVYLLQAPAVANVKEEHMHSIALEQEHPRSIDIRLPMIEAVEGE